MPAKRETFVQKILPEELRLREDDPVSPAINENRNRLLDFPPRVRTGDPAAIQLAIQTAQSADGTITSAAFQYPDLYKTHKVIAEAQFESSWLEIDPPGPVSQPLEAGQSILFRWTFLPTHPGLYRGTLWLHLRFVDKVTGEESRRAISAQFVEIEAVNFLSLSADSARALGAFGSIAGTVIGFPLMAEIVKFLSQRRKPK